MTRITIANVKGGVGKTATSVNLAAFLSRKCGYRVLLVDCDPQGNCLFGLRRYFEGATDEEPQKTPALTLYDCLLKDTPIEDVILPVHGNLSLLPANAMLAVADVELMQETRGSERLKAILPQSGYDYIIIDTPTGIGLLQMSALIAGEMVIVPMPSFIAYEQGRNHLVGLLARIQRGIPDQAWDVRALQTLYRTDVRESVDLRSVLEKEFGKRLFSSYINLNTHVSGALGVGQPITEYPSTTGFTDYFRLTKEVINAAQNIAENRGRGQRATRTR